ncbi:exosortase N [Runella zeae]|uniref:exosortase N n=1 Tax=Runella zeae TaxID=94255 RepID=UPI002354544A|nr:exosortase N [Runella zeae]
MAIFSEPLTFAAGVVVLVASLTRQRRPISWRLTGLVVAVSVWAWLVPMQTIKFLLVFLTLLWIVESSISRQRLWLWAVIGIVISPLFRYLSEVFSFPIRLQISYWAGYLLKLVGYQVEISGNLLTLDGHDFSVDAACIGLHLLGFSYLAGVFLISQASKKHNYRLPLGAILALLMLILGLNIAANLVRIIVLVLGGWPPEHPLHELAGVVCVLVYVWLPLAIIIEGFYHLHPSPSTSLSSTISWGKISISWKKGLVYIGSLSWVIYLLWKPYSASSVVYPTFSAPVGYTHTPLQHGITQLRNSTSLIYLKSIPSFYSVEHSPYICWRGSGYKFRMIKQTNIAGIRCYEAKMTKGQNVLYSAWWFSDGDTHTSSQLDFRWRMLSNERAFYLINVTVSNPRHLPSTIKQMLDTQQHQAFVKR